VDRLFFIKLTLAIFAHSQLYAVYDSLLSRSLLLYRIIIICLVSI
jgi:hypothetical protein